MAKVFLTPEDLADRWCLPITTLDQWRWHGKGPQFVKMGRRVRYQIKDVENFEQKGINRNTCYRELRKDLNNKSGGN